MLRTALLLASLAMSSAALAAPIDFAPMREGAPEEALVKSFLGDDVKADTALVDITNDGKPEVLVRIGDKCDEVPCRTIVYRELPGDWKAVLDRQVSFVEVGSTGLGAVKNLEFDGMVWEWTMDDVYKMNVSRSGKKVSLQPVQGDYALPLAAMFGPNAPLLVQDEDVVLEAGEVRTVDDGDAQILVKMSGGGVCGRVYGCPIRILQVVDGQYQSVLEGFAGDDVVLSEVKRDGRMDVISSLPNKGYAIYAWTGSVYGQSEIMKGY